jgi:two-component system chemotaxis response regulator CheY
VETADHGGAALDVAMSKRFDVVITDLCMPTMDGLTLISRLRALPQYKNTPILALTASGSDETKLASKKAGATGWIGKPFDESKLIAALHRLTA